MSKDAVKILAIILTILFLYMLIFWLITLGKYFDMKHPVGAVGSNYERNLEQTRSWLVYQAWTVSLLGVANVISLITLYKKAPDKKL